MSFNLIPFEIIGKCPRCGGSLVKEVCILFGERDVYLRCIQCARQFRTEKELERERRARG
jgi:uncharacterized C2H2 Zn-finger protein